MTNIKIFAVLAYVPGPQLADELSNMGAYIRVDLCRSLKQAKERAKWTNSVAIEEIGKGIVWIKEAL